MSTLLYSTHPRTPVLVVHVSQEKDESHSHLVHYTLEKSRFRRDLTRAGSSFIGHDIHCIVLYFHCQHVHMAAEGLFV